MTDNNSTNNSNELEENPSLSIVAGIPSDNNSPAESISSNSDDVDEKFDDSFIVMNSDTNSSGDNGQPTSPMAGPTAIAPVSNSPSSGLAEISEVNVNNQGISYNEPVLIDDSGSPLIELVDEDDIENDFSD